jgi:CheY-like chemotaxis protein
MSGALTVTNREDGINGVAFRLELPLELPAARVHHAPTVAAIASPFAPGGGPAMGLHVLVVDDSATNRRIAERCLRGLGCTCAHAEDGDEVPAAVAGARFDVILLDIRMARVNGDAACAALRAGGYVGPIIAVTGNATLVDSDEYRRIGFTATLGKPFGAAELRAVLADTAGALYAPVT